LKALYRWRYTTVLFLLRRLTGVDFFALPIA
jgi:hypothetical protein